MKFYGFQLLTKLLSKYLVWLNSHQILQIIPYWMHGDKLTQLNLNGEYCVSSSMAVLNSNKPCHDVLLYISQIKTYLNIHIDKFSIV